MRAVLVLLDAAQVAAQPRGPAASTPRGLDQALERLERMDAQQARTVELRLFAGLTDAEISKVLQISVATVERHWSAGKRRLARMLCDAQQSEWRGLLVHRSWPAWFGLVA